MWLAKKLVIIKANNEAERVLLAFSTDVEFKRAMCLLKLTLGEGSVFSGPPVVGAVGGTIGVGVGVGVGVWFGAGDMGAGVGGGT